MTMQQACTSKVPINAIAMASRNVVASIVSGTAWAGYQLGSDGIGRTRQGNAASTYSAISGEWRLAGDPAGYTCKATLTSGTDPGNTGVELALTSSRQWQISSSSITVLSFLLIEVFYYGVKVGEATIGLSAEVDP